MLYATSETPIGQGALLEVLLETKGGQRTIRCLRCHFAERMDQSATTNKEKNIFQQMRNEKKRKGELPPIITTHKEEEDGLHLFACFSPNILRAVHNQMDNYHGQGNSK